MARAARIEGSITAGCLLDVEVTSVPSFFSAAAWAAASATRCASVVIAVFVELRAAARWSAADVCAASETCAAVSERATPRADSCWAATALVSSDRTALRLRSASVWCRLAATLVVSV